MAIRFAVDEDYHSSALPTGFNHNQAAWSIACFFNAASTTQDHVIFSVADHDTTNYWWEVLAAGKRAGDPLRVNSKATASESGSDAGSFSAGVWHHCAAVNVSTSSRFPYLDGTVGTEDTANRVMTGMSAISWGSRYNSAPEYAKDVTVSHACVWNIALTGAEVLSLSKGTSPWEIRPNRLVFYAPFIGSEQDFKGLALTATSTPDLAGSYPNVMMVPSRRIFSFPAVVSTYIPFPTGDRRGLTGGIQNNTGGLLC